MGCIVQTRRILFSFFTNSLWELCSQGWLHEERLMELKHKHLILVKKWLKCTFKIWRQNDRSPLYTCIFFWCKTNPSFQTQILYKSKGLHWHHWQAWTFIGWVTTKTRLLWATFMLILHVLSLSLSVSFTPLELSIHFSSWRSYSPQHFTGYEWRKLWFSQSHYEPSTWQVRALILTVSWE